MRRVFADPCTRISSQGKEDRLAALLGITRKLICIILPSSAIQRRNYTMVGSAHFVEMRPYMVTLRICFGTNELDPLKTHSN